MRVVNFEKWLEEQCLGVLEIFLEDVRHVFRIEGHARSIAAWTHLPGAVVIESTVCRSTPTRRQRLMWLVPIHNSFCRRRGFTLTKTDQRQRRCARSPRLSLMRNARRPRAGTFEPNRLGRDFIRDVLLVSGDRSPCRTGSAHVRPSKHHDERW